LWAGFPDIAIKHFETALRLSPRDRRAGDYMGIGVGHFFALRFDDATAMLLRSIQAHPGWPPAYRFLAASYAKAGHLDLARETIMQLRALTPVVMPSAAHWRKPEHRELFLSGPGLAMGEVASGRSTTSQTADPPV
jgi:tetratricopeptide (TPR) repeat protein